MLYFILGYYVYAELILPTRIVVAEVEDEIYVSSYVDGFNTIVLRKDLLEKEGFNATRYPVTHEIAHAHQRKCYDDFYYRDKDFAERFLTDVPSILEVLKEMHTTPYIDYKDNLKGYAAQKTEIYAKRFGYQETFFWEYWMEEIATERGIDLGDCKNRT